MIYYSPPSKSFFYITFLPVDNTSFNSGYKLDATPRSAIASVNPSDVNQWNFELKVSERVTLLFKIAHLIMKYERYDNRVEIKERMESQSFWLGSNPNIRENTKKEIMPKKIIDLIDGNFMK